jgi:hypothetical protein
MFEDLVENPLELITEYYYFGFEGFEVVEKFD